MSYKNDKLKSLFVHIPKCAGTSMEANQWNCGTGHDTIYDYYQNKNIELSDYFKWCFVRNPWERIVSAYEDCPEVLPHAPTFSKFIEIIYKNKNQFKIPHINWSKLPYIGLPIDRIHFFPMKLLICRDYEICVDFVGRYENLPNDWHSLQTKLNIKPQQLPHYNKRKNKFMQFTNDWRSLYSNNLINMVYEIYQDDIDYFNYSYI
jgi:hypothetical protein